MGRTVKTVRVTRLVDVKVDPSKFDEDFMAEFRASFYGLNTLNDHIEYLGRLFALGIVDEGSKFIEGYGDPKDMGIEFIDGGCDTELV